MQFIKHEKLLMISLKIRKVIAVLVIVDTHVIFEYVFLFPVVYGVNTGFGSFASTIIPDDKLAYVS